MTKWTHRVPRSTATVVALCLSACATPSEPLLAGVEVRTEVAPATAMVGDMVTFRAILSNPTDRQLNTGASCGPPVLFELRGGSGHPIYPVPLDLVFTCELTDVHVLEPGETDTLAVRWRVAAAAGDYAVWGGVIRSGEFQRYTKPVGLSIR